MMVKIVINVIKFIKIKMLKDIKLLHWNKINIEKLLLNLIVNILFVIYCWDLIKVN